MSQFHRLKYIDNRIKDFGFVTKKQVADYFQVSLETVKGDIRYMRVEVDSPLVYSKKKGGYYYKEDFDLFCFADEKLFLLFVLIKQLVSNKNFVPLDPSGFIDRLKEEIEPKYLKIADKISYEISEFEYPDMEKFEKIIKAMQRRLPLLIEYIDAKGNSSQRTVEPLHIFNYQGKWTLLAHCRLRDGLRMFTLSRMKQIDTEGSIMFKLNRYKKSEIMNRLDEGFGIARGKEVETAVIHFREPTLHHVIDQKWHPEQKNRIIDSSDGQILEFKLPVAKYEELVGRVLRFSPDAEIIKPAKMRQMWLKKLKESVVKYK